MLKQIVSALFLCALFGSAFSQTDKYTAPVNWQRYKVSEKSVSVLFPKMPVLIDTLDACSQLERNTYSAYAEETVFQLIISSKSKEKIPEYCSVKRKFDRQIFEERLQELEKNSEKSDKTDSDKTGKNPVKISGKLTTYWIFDDLKNDKWVELVVTHRPEIKVDEEKFVQSIAFEKNSSGVEIAGGATQSFGDETEAEIRGETLKENSAQKSTDEKAEAIIIVAKPRPRYTEAARQTNVQGTVTLRVAFLSNGGIGNVGVVSALSHGLTEQAIAAAKKISFIPAKKNGKTYNVTKAVQYSFSIY